VEAALGRLRKQGYLDDARFADAFTRHEALERGAGARLVRHELRAHGVGEPLVAQAAAVAAAAELDTAREVARRALPGLAALAPEARVRRLAGRLARRGYASAIVYQVVRETFGGARLGESGEAAIEALGMQGEAGDPGEAD